MSILTVIDELHARKLAFRQWWGRTQRSNKLPEDAGRDAFFAGWRARAEWQSETPEGEPGAP